MNNQLGNTNETFGFLTLKEQAAFYQAIWHGSPDETRFDSTAKLAFEWARQTLIRQAIFSSILKGKVYMSLNEEGELLFIAAEARNWRGDQRTN
jgi:hypothetical protein